MALSAINTIITGHFAKGGVKTLTLGEYDGTAAMTVAANHEVTVTPASSPVVIDFEKETAKLTVSTTQEKGLAMSTCSIEGYVPNMTAALMEDLNNLIGVGMYAECLLWEGGTLVVGWDSVLGRAGGDSDFALFLESIEADTGSALSDQNGVTIKLTAVQGETPRGKA